VSGNSGAVFDKTAGTPAPEEGRKIGGTSVTIESAIGIAADFSALSSFTVDLVKAFPRPMTVRAGPVFHAVCENRGSTDRSKNDQWKT
jgi:hypothetical protein